MVFVVQQCVVDILHPCGTFISQQDYLWFEFGLSLWSFPFPPPLFTLCTFDNPETCMLEWENRWFFSFTWSARPWEKPATCLGCILSLSETEEMNLITPVMLNWIKHVCNVDECLDRWFAWLHFMSTLTYMHISMHRLSLNHCSSVNAVGKQTPSRVGTWAWSFHLPDDLLCGYSLYKERKNMIVEKVKLNKKK